MHLVNHPRSCLEASAAPTSWPSKTNAGQGESRHSVICIPARARRGKGLRRLIDGPTTGESFLAYVEEAVLVPFLRPSSTISAATKGRSCGRPRHRRNAAPQLRPQSSRASLHQSSGRRPNLCGTRKRIEPPRVCRRPFGLSYAAMAGCSSMA